MILAYAVTEGSGLDDIQCLQVYLYRLQSFSSRVLCRQYQAFRPSVVSVQTQEEQKSAANGAKTAISLHIADITATVSDTEKELIAKKLSVGQSAGMYLDIVLKAAVGESTRVVTDTNEALTMKITVPESLRNTDTSKKRTYDIVRVHGKDAVVLSSEFNQDDMTITFTTGQFSTYAVVYKDTAVTPEQPTIPEQPTTPEIQMSAALP